MQVINKQESNSNLLQSSSLVSSLFADSSLGLAQVEQRIKQTLKSDATQLTEISEYLLGLGGKRIRPIFALSSASLFGMIEPSQQLVDASSGIELIHMATLLHDDIIDDSPIRRHQISPFKKYGLAPSLLTGDFLLARAFGLCSKLDRFIIEHTEQACVELTEGELLEGTLDPTTGKSFEDYLTVIEKKTASLFLLASAVGAHVAGAEQDSVNRLTKFGRLAGVAFQMVDDILDVVADEDLLGKPTGTDLRQKTPSLVNCLWLDSKDPVGLEFFENPLPTSEQALVAAKYLRNSTIVSKARKIATDYSNLAKQQLQDIDDKKLNPVVRDNLITLLDYTLLRSVNG